jgi:hypothetical protein
MIIKTTDYSTQDPRLDWDVLPFWSVSALYLAALVRINHCQDGTKLREDIRPAIDYLKHFQPKWSIAGIHFMIFSIHV